MEKEKKKKELKNLLSLKVDIVKQGAGTTNSGNVARVFVSKRI